MTLSVVRKPPKEALAQLERVVLEGDLATLSDSERIGYYARVCESLGLNPLTRPFEYIRLNSKLTLYARKDATDQLRKINGVSVERLERERDEDLSIVTAYGRDRSGRTDSSIGAVSVKGLSGEALANALMKAETKAKRRLTLSLAGLGWLDETETEGPLTATVSVDPVTGAIETSEAQERQHAIRDRIAQRTAALRGESTGESEGSEPLAGTRAESERERHAAGAEPGESVSPPPAAPRRGDPWMARLHAVGNERGYDHDALHDWATRLYGIASLTDLNPKQRGEFMHRVEVLPLIGESCAHPAEQHVVTDTALTCGACGEVIADRTQPGRAARAHAEGSPAPASTSAPADEDAPASEGGGVRSGALPSDSDAASESSPSGSATSPAQAASPPGSPESVVAPATFTDPAALETYGAAVLGFEEPVPLKDWAPAEFEQVWSALGLADPSAYEAWYTALERPLRAALMTAHQSPAARRKAAKEAATAKPDAETLRMGLDA